MDRATYPQKLFPVTAFIALAAHAFTIGEALPLLAIWQ